jgi:hypothetical protein
MRCGATHEAACACDAGYVPATQFAVKNWKSEYNGMTDRLVGVVIGVDRETVQRARAVVGSTERKASNRKRLGEDSKRYKETKPKRALSNRGRHGLPKKKRMQVGPTDVYLK